MNKKILLIIVLLVLFVILLSVILFPYRSRFDSTNWYLFYPTYGHSKHSSLNDCKIYAEAKYIKEGNNSEIKFLCATSCIQVLDSMVPAHCEKAVIGECSGGNCEYFENTKKMINDFIKK